MELTNNQQSRPSWHQLLGTENWEGLLQPLNIDLLKLILRCGDFCQATYDAFNNDENSKYCGSSRYGKASFFDKVMLENASHYEVTSFLYATAKVSTHKAFLLHSLSRERWDRESNWIGYVAVTSDDHSLSIGRREIYVAWRGTSRDYEWVDVLGARLESTQSLLHQESIGTGGSFNNGDHENNAHIKIMKGWLTIYTSDDPNSPFTKLSAREQLLRNIRQLLEKYKDENVSITFTGHSLGASLSVLAAFDLADNGITDIPISAIIFGCPRVGNHAFNEKLKKFTNVKILHVRNKIDVIPHYPTHLMGYVDSGTELFIDTRKSNSLKPSKNPSDWHNLQGMLHTVAGWNGEHEEFKLRVDRSLALVNKSSEFLKDECLIPGSWWVEKNRGMVLDEHGHWVLAPPADEDLPVPECYSD